MRNYKELYEEYRKVQVGVIKNSIEGNIEALLQLIKTAGDSRLVTLAYTQALESRQTSILKYLQSRYTSEILNGYNLLNWADVKLQETVEADVLEAAKSLCTTIPAKIRDEYPASEVAAAVLFTYESKQARLGMRDMYTKCQEVITATGCPCEFYPDKILIWLSSSLDIHLEINTQDNSSVLKRQEDILTVEEFMDICPEAKGKYVLISSILGGL